jgi:2-polyprenyl-6-hydroxyphenyl methylase/3-demethylubiquinone-9 3-methyltransferase
MPVDNRLYDRRSGEWWDEDSFLGLLRLGVNPARFGYFREVLERMGIDPRDRRALDIGCGGGLLAEEFARLGCRVTGVDPSEPSLRTAREHARASGLEIDYRRGTGEHLPLPDRSFDITYCCDVLEHVDDLDRVIAETARVLVPGGIYFYDTINRTPVSRLVNKVIQDWEPTSFVDPGLHDPAMFIRPRELRAAMERHGLASCGLVGLRPGGNPLSLLRALRLRKTGRISGAELSRRLAFRRARDTLGSYMGWAVRVARPPA